MIFPIVIVYHKKPIRLSVEQLFIDDRTERYQVTGSNGIIIIESNRPLFRGKGLKRRNPDWKQIEGKSLGGTAFKLICSAIQANVEKEPK
jgi:hypothetical protein